MDGQEHAAEVIRLDACEACVTALRVGKVCHPRGLARGSDRCGLEVSGTVAHRRRTGGAECGAIGCRADSRHDEAKLANSKNAARLCRPLLGNTTTTS